MKKYKVIKNFVDKYTKESCYTGDVLELTPERAEELEGYVEEVKGKKNGK